MSDMEDQLRELLRKKADRVPPRGQVPRRMLARAHRRAAMTGIAAAVVAAAVAFGSYTGIQALGRVKAVQPIQSPPVSPAPSGHNPLPGNSPTPGVCYSTDLSGSIQTQGAAGQRFGSILLTNRSASRCTLKGSPNITFLDANGRRMPVQPQVGATEAWWQINRQPKPAGWPVVVLGPGQTAQIRWGWGNWCGPGQPKTWRIDLPLHLGSLDLEAPTDAPPCNGPGSPSTLQIGPIEPQG